MRRLVVTVALLALALAAGPKAGAQEARTVTLARALELARANQPDTKVSRGAAIGAHASADQVRAARQPQLSADASYSAGADTRTGKARDPSQSVSVGLTGRWLLWDFGVTSARIAGADASASSLDASATKAELDLALDVRTAYFAARAAKALVEVAKADVANEEKHVQQIEAFVEVGRRPEIDKYQARTQLANARVTLIQRENDYDVARAQLARAMGDPAHSEFDIGDDVMAAVDGEDGSDDALYAQAIRSRPDLVALEDSRRASQAELDGAHGAYLPALSASAGLDSTPFQTHTTADPYWGWNVGLTLSWDIFDGGARAAVIRGAEADVMVADARRESLAQNVRVEVRQARLAVRAAKASRAAADEVATNAKKQLELAEGRYAEGVGNAIELGDAQVAMSAAAAQVVSADYNLSTARAQLLHALGL
jgi:outer membrane protein